MISKPVLMPNAWRKILCNHIYGHGFFECITLKGTHSAQEKNMKKYSFIRNNNNNNEEKYHKIKLINVLDYYYYMDEMGSLFPVYFSFCVSFALSICVYFFRCFLSFYFCNVSYMFNLNFLTIFLSIMCVIEIFSLPQKF